MPNNELTRCGGHAPSCHLNRHFAQETSRRSNCSRQNDSCYINALAALIGSCCLLMSLASLAHCAPTTTIPSQPQRHHSQQQQQQHKETSTMEQRNQLTATQHQTSSISAPSVAPVAIFQVEPASKRPTSQQQSAQSDEEIFLLVLTSETASAQRLSRLIKRSGISDQRLAEIQMIRALKKQLERDAASKVAGQTKTDDSTAANAAEVDEESKAEVAAAAR